jgi:antirestriction protein ArdC
VSNNDVRLQITRTIAEGVKNGCPVWRQPWGDKSEAPSSGLPRNFVKHRRYNGINILILLHAAQSHRFSSPLWGTENQWEDIGARIKPRPHHVPRGKWGSDIILFYQFSKEKISPIPNVKSSTLMGMKLYTVYNLDQVGAPSPEEILKLSKKKRENLAYKYLGFRYANISLGEAKLIHERITARLNDKRAKDQPLGEVYPVAESIIRQSNATIFHGSNKAFYRWSEDVIYMPCRDQFNDLTSYYMTMFHELCHWSEAENRIGKSPKHKDTDDTYAFSELVAEIGACLLATEIGLPVTPEMFPNSTSYVKYWLDRMGSDSKYIFEAAVWSGRIVDYLLAMRAQEQAA